MFLFGKKKEVLEEQAKAVADRAPRYNTLASISINGFDGEALLKNISLTGFCLESITYVKINPGTTYSMRILPEAAGAGVEGFDVEVKALWVQSDVSKFDVGFQLTQTQSRRGMDKYIEFLKQKGVSVS